LANRQSRLVNIAEKIVRMSPSSKFTPFVTIVCIHELLFHWMGAKLQKFNPVKSTQCVHINLKMNILHEKNENQCAKVESWKPFVGVWIWNICSLCYLKSMLTWKVQWRKA
jgi:hypothetical protein